MREIKFRAWSPEYKRMLNNLCLGDGVYDYSKYPVMQYTGLKDKNGKEIYEGDILTLFNEKYIVVFNNGSFGFKSPYKNEYGHYFTMSASQNPQCDINREKIGNIYENPELLGGFNEKA